MAFPIKPKYRSGAAGNPTSLNLAELAVNTFDGSLYLGADAGVMLLNGPVAAGTVVTEHTGNGSTTAFTFAGYNGTADGGYLVSVGGIDQPPSTYSISDTAGGTITFSTAPVDGELISIRAIVAGSGGGGDGNATQLQGRDINAQAPDNKMVLAWSGTLMEWFPSFAEQADAIKLQGAAISATSPTTGNLLKFDGTEWVPFDGMAVVNWKSGASYAVGDQVFNYGIIYICINFSGVTSSTPPVSDPSNWQQMFVGTGLTPSNTSTVATWIQTSIEGSFGYIPVYR
jgi:hypothetical protein